MKHHMARLTLVTGSVAAAFLLSACSDKVENAPESIEQSNATLASVLASADSLRTTAEALSETGLHAVFDGPSFYTVLAPKDVAFETLGKSGTALMGEDQRAVLVALLRDHIVPGSLDTEAVRSAIAAKGGPVEMTTLGDSVVRFALDGDTLTVRGTGEPVRIDTAAAVIASNGVVMPIEGLLKRPPGADSTAAQ